MTLVVALGGVRSGKSRWAERRVAELAGDVPVRVLVSGDESDASMDARIAAHRARRPAGWESERIGTQTIAAALDGAGPVLVDGLGAWIAGVMAEAGVFAAPDVPADSPDASDADQAALWAPVDDAIDLARGEIVDGLDVLVSHARAGHAVVVATEEVGLGPLPAGAGSRAWVDLMGEANERLAAAADEARLIVAGQPIALRPASDGQIGVAAESAADGVTASADVETAAAVDDDADAAVDVAGVAGDVTGETGGTVEPHEDGDGPPGDAVSAGDVPSAGARPDHAAAELMAEGEWQGPATGTGDAMARAAHAAEASSAAARSGEEAPGDDDLLALRSHGDRLVRPGDQDHAVNVDETGPPVWLVGAMADAHERGDLLRYPDRSAALRAVASRHGRRVDEVLVTNGGAEGLWLLGPGLRPQLACVVHPVFTESEAGLRAHGIPVTRVHRDPEADFALDVSAVPDDADLVVLGNPVAACGALDPAASIRALLRPGRTVVVDEAFIDQVPSEDQSLVEERAEGLLVVRSLTKSLAVPGLRCGYVVGDRALIRRLAAVQPPWPVNVFALAAITAAMEHPGELAARGRRAAGEREDLVERISAIQGLRIWPSSTNHVLVHARGASRAAEQLREQGIIVRPCGTFPGLTDDHLRITARSAPANAALAEALGDALRAVRRAELEGVDGDADPAPDPRSADGDVDGTAAGAADREIPAADPTDDGASPADAHELTNAADDAGPTTSATARAALGHGQADHGRGDAMTGTPRRSSGRPSDGGAPSPAVGELTDAEDLRGRFARRGASASGSRSPRVGALGRTDPRRTPASAPRERPAATRPASIQAANEQGGADAQRSRPPIVQRGRNARDGSAETDAQVSAPGGAERPADVEVPQDVSPESVDASRKVSDVNVDPSPLAGGLTPRALPTTRQPSGSEPGWRRRRNAAREQARGPERSGPDGASGGAS